MQLQHPNICEWYQIKIKMVTSTSIVIKSRVEVAQLDCLILLYGENNVPSVRIRYPQRKELGARM
jgi:hypothetical protein